MKRTLMVAAVLSVAALSVSAAPALARTAEEAPQGVQIPDQDKDFFEAAAQGGLLEVKLGQIVVASGSNEDVKGFAQRMIDDHTKLGQKLADIGQRQGLAVPQGLDKKHQDALDRMSQYSGTKLDQEYMRFMVSEHRDDLKAFEKEAQDGTDPAIKQFASAALSTLNEHLALARQIYDRIRS
jgi:putative membrane protein